MVERVNENAAADQIIAFGVAISIIAEVHHATKAKVPSIHKLASKGSRANLPMGYSDRQALIMQQPCQDSKLYIYIYKFIYTTYMYLVIYVYT